MEYITDKKAYVLPKANNPTGQEIEIGDIKQDINFYPQIKIKCWDNETNFSIRLYEDIEGSTEILDGEQVKWTSPDGNTEVFLYEVGPEEVSDVEFQDGGFEYKAIFHAPPASNEILFTIRHKGLRFVKQRKLTQDEIDEGHEQPERAIGSYAVFHESKMHNEYRTGKAFHIFRPFVEDLTGARSWCDININTDDDILKLIIPKDFLDKAIYPVVLDPTFGYTTAGANSAPFNLNTAGGSSGAPASNGTISKITFHGQAWSGKYMDVKAVIWDYGGGNNVITNGVGNVLRISGGTKTWYDINYSTQPSVVASTSYICGYVTSPETNGYNRLSYDFDSPNGFEDYANNYNSPDAFSQDNSERKFSVYATYDEGPEDITGILPLFRPVRT